jgi:dihydroorotate dehydrogenase
MDVPDWSYQTVFRPLLFQLTAPQARDLTLGAMGRLSRLPLGPQLIELMGHMAPPPGLAVAGGGLHFATPVGLDAGLDPHLLGLQPLSQFGFGYVEVGPVTEAPLAGSPVRRAEEREAIWQPGLPANIGVDAFKRRLANTRSRVPVGMRLAHAPGAGPDEAATERLRLMEALRRHAAFFTLTTTADWAPEDWDAHLSRVVPAAGRPALLVLAPDTPSDHGVALLSAALRHGAAGAVISSGVATKDGGRLDGPLAQEPALALLRTLRARLGPDLLLIAGGGIHAPADALAFLEAGASLVHISSGLVYTGPGLPKRINEAVAHRRQAAAEAAFSVGERGRRTQERGRGWMGALLMAWGILIGAALATWIALTRVVLPYDEAFVGLSRAQLDAINPRLLHFMEHDRISLSGTMGASAVLFLFLAWFPWRRGEHWVRPAYLVPATLGFLAFFLYPAYGYFEPLHALFYALLLPFYLWALLSRQRGEPAAPPTGLQNDWSWLLGQWGQLLWIVLAAGGTVAGLTITAIGVTRVFVPEDLAFMGTTAEALRAVDRLVPLIAHDRVGFGTALVCNGMTVLLMALWGFRRGARWLWWAFALAGVPSYLGAFGTHIGVGYIDLWHLTPPAVGLGVLLAALVCSYPYLSARE